MEASTNLGRVSVVPRGVYDPAERYDRLDIVEYGGSSYLALRPVQGVVPEDGADYMLLAQGGRDGAPGADGRDGAAGADGSSIASIERTGGTGAPGTTDTYTITLTDGSASTFQVYNGADGQGAGDMTKAVYDPQNRAQDIFQYVDDALKDVPAPENLVTIPGGGAVEPPAELGDGPYTVELDGGGELAKASEVSYDSGSSGLEAGTVQEALDQLGAVKADAWRVSGRNLLDNWYFADPVNQLGQMEYADNGYSIDRWFIFNGSVEIGTEEIVVRANKGDRALLRYNMEPELYAGLIGKTVCCAMLYKCTGSGYIYMYAGGTGSPVIARYTDNDDWTIACGTHIPVEPGTANQDRQFIIRLEAGTELHLKAAKLEEGSVQTLAHQDEDGTWVLNDPPPDKTTELLKCQRYQKLIPLHYKTRMIDYSSIQMRFSVDLAVPMRAVPTIAKGDFVVRSLDMATIYTDFTFRVEECIDNYATIVAAKSNHGLTDGYLWARENSVILDANL